MHFGFSHHLLLFAPKNQWSIKWQYQMDAPVKSKPLARLYVDSVESKRTGGVPTDNLSCKVQLDPHAVTLALILAGIFPCPFGEANASDLLAHASDRVDYSTQIL